MWYTLNPHRNRLRMTNPQHRNELCEESKTFTCQLCGFSCRFDVFGSKGMKESSSLMLMEEAFLLEDPFTVTKQMPIILGALCSKCSVNVCVGQTCSYFYGQRFCRTCIMSNLQSFPLEVQEEAQKRFSDDKNSS